MKNKEAWKEFDEQYLTPYEDTGSLAKDFDPGTIVFSYTALRHMAYHAFQAGVNSQEAP